MIAAVTNQGKVRVMIYPGELSPQRLIKDARCKVFLILDNLNVRRAKLVREWLGRHADQIEVFYLSPYSPELDPRVYADISSAGTSAMLRRSISITPGQ
jgi:transposase